MSFKSFYNLLTKGSLLEEAFEESEHLHDLTREMFLQSQPGKPHSAFLLLDNAIIRKDEIMEHVKKGYLVRSRTDIDTYEAKVNDKTRSVAAFESGAQVLSTDYFKPGNAYGTDYFITLPGNNPVRVNPINSNGSYVNKK